MSWQHKVTLMLIFCLMLVVPAPASASEASVANPTGLFLAAPEVSYLCPSSLTRRTPGACPEFSPGARQTRLNYVRSHLPNPLPALPVEELEIPDDAITPYRFAYVRPLPAAAYRHPEEAAAGLPPVREFLAGDNWLSVMGQVEYEGELWYQINPGEYLRASHLAFTNPSRFRGVLLSEQPAYPFGWINRGARPSAEPGGPPRGDVLLNRYDTITIYVQELMGDEMWYMVGPDQWVEQSYTSRVTVAPIPEGVGPDEKWIEINTYEQTMAAYEGSRMVFATLVSTGRRDAWTPNGLNRIWYKTAVAPMQNRRVSLDSPRWYYLESVEWTQYFFRDYAIHAAYWHDVFGFIRSSGCVNLSILDAQWLFEWTTPHVPEGSRIAHGAESGPNMGTWVWVHMTGPFPEDTN